MTTIWKRELNTIGPDDTFKIDAPKGAKFLTVQMQYGSPTIWFLCDTEQPMEPRIIQWAGTGINIENPHELTYIATVQIENARGGTFVNHYFERAKK